MKASLPAGDITSSIPKLLEQIQQDMFDKAKSEVDGRRIVVEKWEDLVPVLDKKNTAILPWCEEPACEEDIKDRSNKESLAASKLEDDDRAPSSGAKTLCIPFDQSRWPSIEGKCCPACGKKAKRWTMFGRSTSALSSLKDPPPADVAAATHRLLNVRSNRGSKGPADEPRYCMRSQGAAGVGGLSTGARAGVDGRLLSQRYHQSRRRPAA